MQTTLLVLISIFLILFAIGFIVYAVFFIIHKIYFKKELELMEKYNELTGKVSSLNMFKLDFLAKNNSSIANNISNIKKQYSILHLNLKTIYKSIQILAKEIQTFNLKPSRTHINVIQKDIEQCQQDFKKIKIEYERFTSYSDTIANMFNMYIELNEKLRKFFKTRIIYHSDFKKIQVLFASISKTISSIPAATVNFDFKKVIQIWLDLHTKVQALIKVISAVLKFQIIISYLEASMNKNNEIIGHSYESIDEVDKQMLRRCTNSFNISYAKLLKAYRSFDLNKAQAYAIEAILNLNQINNFVSIHTQAADVIAVSLNEISNQTNTILSNKQQILDSITSIQDYFVKEVRINEWFDEIIDNINTIEKLTDQSKYISHKTHDQKASAMASLASISKNIFIKKEEISNLIDNVNDALNRIITTITDLNDLYIYFWQMLIAIKEISPDDIETKSVISLIENNLKLIEQYTQDIIKQEDPNYELISKNLNNIVEHVHQIYGKIGTNITLKNMARKLMVYCNRYKTNANKVTFAKANGLYKGKKYSQCIEELLSIYKKIKSRKHKS